MKYSSLPLIIPMKLKKVRVIITCFVHLLNILVTSSNQCYKYRIKLRLYSEAVQRFRRGNRNDDIWKTPFVTLKVSEQTNDWNVLGFREVEREVAPTENKSLMIELYLIRSWARMELTWRSGNICSLLNPIRRFKSSLIEKYTASYFTR